MTFLREFISDNRVLLKNRNFVFLWLTDGISVLGNFFTDIALVLLVYDRTQSSISVGMTLLAKVLSSLLFAPFVGSWVDSWSAKRVILLSNLLRGALVVLLPFAPAGVVFYAVLILLPLGELLFFPARTSLLSSIVPKEQYMRANSISSFTGTLFGLGGPAVAGWLIAVKGFPYAFMIDGLTFAIAFLLTLPIASEIKHQPSKRVKPFNREILDYIRGNPMLRFGLASLFLGMFVLGAHNVVIVVHAQRVLHAGPAGWGILSSAISMGALVGSLVCVMVNKWLGRQRAIMTALFATGLGLLAFSFGTQLWHVVLVRFSVGMVFVIFTISQNTLLQEASLPDFRGRLFSMAAILRNIALALGIGAVSLSADVHGTSAVLATLGCATIVLILPLALMQRRHASQQNLDVALIAKRTQRC